MNNAETQYNERKGKYQSLIAEHTRSINQISNLRLIVFLIGAALGIYLFVQKKFGFFALDLIIFLALFIYLILRHEHYFIQKKYAAILLKINEDSLHRIRGEWTSFTDDGKEFKDDKHPYTQDLDIFGQGSLFQLINTATTYLGRLRVRDLLSSHPSSTEEISLRQEAVIDLHDRLEWRQQLMAEGFVASKMHDPELLFTWARKIESFYRKRWVIVILSLLPVITIAIGIVTMVIPEMNYYALTVLLWIHFLILKIYQKKRGNTLGVAYTYTENIAAYHKMLQLLESEKFQSPYLNELQSRLKNYKGHTACTQIRQLAKIVDGISNRHSQLYFIFNILFLLDYQFMFALEKWKDQSGRDLRDWLHTIAEVEALSSLAVLRYDHPEWAMPVITEDRPVFAAKEMGHPLIHSGVFNDLHFQYPEKILLITGSNMSGKSTLLRSAGINLVLAYAGTVVCSKTFTCSRMGLYTCMRVSDNLEMNISSFYAELLRIKMIVEAVDEGKEIFFLLDEIFKGTNSIDRHTGAKALITKFSQEKLLGMVSTHDLELGELDKGNKHVKNYHFQEYYVNDEIRFDYKLRPGVSTTRNAAFLMKMAGIDMPV